VDLDFYDAFNMSALDIAFAEREDDAAKLIMNKGGDPNKPNPKGFTPFMTLISTRNRKMVKYLIDTKKVDVNKVTGDKMLSPLKVATTSGTADILSDIVEAGVDDINKKDHEGNTALHYAAKANDIKKVKVLLKAGANPQVLNKKKETPFQIARTLQEKGDSRMYDLIKNA
jgi:ankyrin repeat protein